MGYNTTMNTVMTRLREADKETFPDSKEFLYVLQIPACQTMLRSTYDGSNVLIKTKLKEALKDMCDRFLRTDDGTTMKGAIAEEEEEEVRDLNGLMLHMLNCLRTQQHATHANVRRWASMSEAMSSNPETKDFLCRAVKGVLVDPKLRALLRACLAWTMSESCKLGSPLMPYVARR